MTPGCIEGRDEELRCDTASITSRYLACVRCTGCSRRTALSRLNPRATCADSGEELEILGCAMPDSPAWIGVPSSTLARGFGGEDACGTIARMR